MYMDTNCSYVETFEPEHGYTFTGVCTVTKKEVSVFVKASELFKLRQGEYIQNALVSNNAGEREFLMSGMSGEGFDFMVAGITEEDE